MYTTTLLMSAFKPLTDDETDSSTSMSYNNTDNNSEQTGTYLSVNKFCPCKMRILDRAFEDLKDIIPTKDLDSLLIHGKIEPKSVIIDLRIFDGFRKNKREHFIPLVLPTDFKRLLSPPYSRFPEYETPYNVAFGVSDKVPITEISKRIESLISINFPGSPARTFLNYTK